MDFFEQQEQARRETRRLVIYFVFAVASIVFAVYLVIGPAALIFSEPKSRRYEAVAQLFSLLFSDPFGFLRWVWHPTLFLCIAACTVAVISIGSIYKIYELSEGGSAVASLLGGRLINTHTTDPAEQRLRNVVEEMSIAAGTPVPEIYVLDGEPGINAFAAGHSTSDAAIGVTHGCLNILNRDELQAVIAHEFSHVLNGDMRLDMRMIGLLNGILCLAIIGKLMLRVTFGPATSENRRGFSINSLPLALLGLALLVVGSIGVFFGRLIKSAICRQREFLADAAAVQFTRHADALVSALKKMGGYPRGSRIHAVQGETVSQIFFGNSLFGQQSRLLSTHPPLEERIRAFDPAFDGHYPKVEPPPLTPAEVENLQATAYAALLTASPNLGESVLVKSATSSSSPSLASSFRVASLRASLPPVVAQALNEPPGAVALIYTLLLSSDDDMHNAQLQMLREKSDPAVQQEILQLRDAVKTLDDQKKLPLIDLAIPTLRRLAKDQFVQFDGNVQALVEADGAIDLFEYTLQKILFRHLRVFFETPQRPAIQYFNVKSALPECVVLLSALAQMGQDEPAVMEAAFQRGVQHLDVVGVRPAMLVHSDCNLSQIDAALDRLSRAAPMVKKNILFTCGQTVIADRKVQPREAELLRAIADALDCPVPGIVAELGKF